MVEVMLLPDCCYSDEGPSTEGTDLNDPAIKQDALLLERWILEPVPRQWVIQLGLQFSSIPYTWPCHCFMSLNPPFLCGKVETLNTLVHCVIMTPSDIRVRVGALSVHIPRGNCSHFPLPKGVSQSLSHVPSLRNGDRFIEEKALLLAVRSFVFFSQLSAWLSVSHGAIPRNILYRYVCPAGKRISI